MILPPFKHVSYQWDTTKASGIREEVDLLVYRSNLLGADLRLTNYGGGNTSCKATSTDPLTGKPVEVMWVKGSGGDLGTMKRNGLAALYLDRLHQLRQVYRGLAFEDEMVALFNHCIFETDSKAPSIDTPLHAFLPFRHIDHLHPDAVIAIAAARDGEKITRELFHGALGWVPWQRPGFDLGLKMLRCLEENAAQGQSLKGIILGSHGLFSWGDTAQECYLNTLTIIETCADFIDQNIGKKRAVFGGTKRSAPDPATRSNACAALAPRLRGLCSSQQKMVGHFSDAPSVMEFVLAQDLERLAAMGTSCPDHFLRTKIAPLVLDPDKIEQEGYLEQAFKAYRIQYQAYYEECRKPNSPQMRDPNPVILLIPGMGMFSFAKDKTTARLASEYYTNAIQVMRGAEAISTYTALPRQEAFDIEYWLLEEAKLQRMPKPRPLSGRIALITGSGGGIGKAIARKFVAEGACVVLSDLNRSRLEDTLLEFRQEFGSDPVCAVSLDVTDAQSVENAFSTAALAFGGVDIVVNNAGISISAPLAEHTEQAWDQLYDILVKGQFLVSQAGVRRMRAQGFGGDILNIVSKNAVVAGPNNTGYGSAKAAQAHMTRLLAAELGPDQIRVNAIYPDAVIEGSNIWSGGWAQARAEAYGIQVEELPAYYAKRTLLQETILPEDIANACFAFVGGLLNKTTGNALNVDGGVAMGFLR